MRFEQDRGGLDPAQTLRRALAPEGDAVIVAGPERPRASWAKRFLFRPEQLEVSVGRLSGGEQARILIARLMREPADLLLLDEPTNDLDIPTLEVLEDSLAEFAGGLVLVTHDRFMLERVSTVILALDGRGGAATFADYAQWEAARDAGGAGAAQAGRSAPPERERARPKRLGYLEQREWDGMEQAILDAEAALEACRARGRRSGDRLRSRRAPGALRRARRRPRRGRPALRALGRARGQAGLSGRAIVYLLRLEPRFGRGAVGVTVVRRLSKLLSSCRASKGPCVSLRRRGRRPL